jgi:hypothetical protein
MTARRPIRWFRTGLIAAAILAVGVLARSLAPPPADAPANPWCGHPCDAAVAGIS